MTNKQEMTNTMQDEEYEKIAVVQTMSKKYGQCAMDLQYHKKIGKVRWALVNKRDQQKGVLATNFMNVAVFRIIAQDVCNDRFQNYNAKDEKAKGSYVEFKGSEKAGKIEARKLEINFLDTQRIPYVIKIQMGEGQKIKNGAVKMVGDPKMECGIFLTEFQFKVFLGEALAKIDQRDLVDRLVLKVGKTVPTSAKQDTDSYHGETHLEGVSDGQMVDHDDTVNDGEVKGSSMTPVSTGQSQHEAESDVDDDAFVFDF